MTTFGIFLTGDDQEIAQSDRNSHSRNRDGKKNLNLQSGFLPGEHIVSRVSN